MLAMLLANSAQADTPEKVSGQVVKVDTESGKVTLKHARIKSINMAAMTMPFKVMDAEMLKTVKPGDQVRFSVAVVEGNLVVTQMDAVKTRRVRP